MLGGIGLGLWDWLAGRTIPEAIILVLALLMLVTLIPRFRSVRESINPSPSAILSPGLESAGWHASDRGKLPIHWPDAYSNPSWFCVHNTHATPAKTAKNVTARLEFTNTEKTELLLISEACWFEEKRMARTKEGMPESVTVERWSHAVEIEGGNEQSFVLFVQNKPGDLLPHKNGSEPLGPLDYDHWDVKITVSADNVKGFEGILGFTLSRNRLAPDHPAFVRLRDVPPRLESRCQK